MGPQWDGTLLCTIRSFVQWGHNGTPKCNGNTMGWDPIVHYGDLHAMGTQWDPEAQRGHNGMGLNCALWGPSCNGATMGPQSAMGM